MTGEPSHVLDALLVPEHEPLPDPSESEKAALWDALMGSARLRILGYAPPEDSGYAHFGLEAWTLYPGHDFSESNADARRIITEYCRAAQTIGIKP